MKLKNKNKKRCKYVDSKDKHNCLKFSTSLLSSQGGKGEVVLDYF